MKKILTLFIAISLVFSSMSVYAAPSHREEDIAALLYELNIMKGDPDGNLRLDDYVKRSEFSKIAIAASIYRNSVPSNMTISPFKDVSFKNWSAPYVKLAVSNKLVTGYPDSTFKPDNNVVYEEAVTIVLKLLGYSDADFGAAWPYGQTGLADNLKLNENVNAGIGNAMTRRDVMHLIYNMLNTDSKGTTTEYIVNLNYKIVEDTVLIATAEDNTVVGSDKVMTSSGTYKIDSTFDHNNIGKKGDVILKNGDEFVSFIPSQQVINEYNVYQVLDDDIAVIENGQITSLGLDMSSTYVYYKAANVTLNSIKVLLNPGDTITTYRNENGVLDYGFVSSENLEGPITVKSSDWANTIGLGSNLTVMRDGVKVSSSDIQTNDILYYSKSISTVWAYSKKVTGIYESASPNKDMPTSITVSGVTYPLEGVSAYKAVSSAGSFNYGDTITLLIGRSGSVADVISPSNTNASFYGYLLGTGTKIYTDSVGNKTTSYGIKAVNSSGDTFEFACSRDYTNYLSSIVKVSSSGGNTNISIVNYNNDISGVFDADNLKLGKESVAPDVKIIDVSLSGVPKAGTFTKVYPQRLDGTNILASDILYLERNEKNEISDLILKDVTGDTADYGMMISADKSNRGISGSYKYDINGTVKTQSSQILYPVESGQAIKLTYANGAINTMTALIQLPNQILGVSDTYLEYMGGKYPLSDNVKVYKRSGTFNEGYFIIPLSDITGDNFKNYTVSAYFDKRIEDGGRIRVIVVSEKSK